MLHPPASELVGLRRKQKAARWPIGCSRVWRLKSRGVSHFRFSNPSGGQRRNFAFRKRRYEPSSSAPSDRGTIGEHQTSTRTHAYGGARRSGCGKRGAAHPGRWQRVLSAHRANPRCVASERVRAPVARSRPPPPPPPPPGQLTASQIYQRDASGVVAIKAVTPEGEDSGTGILNARPDPDKRSGDRECGKHERKR